MVVAVRSHLILNAFTPTDSAPLVNRSPETHVKARSKRPRCSMHVFLSLSYHAVLYALVSSLPFSALSLSPSLFFSICDVESSPYLMCSSFSISISRQVASGAMLEPARPTPPIYLPCATPRMATCLWMVAMLTMSQVRLKTPAHQNLLPMPKSTNQPLGYPPPSLSFAFDDLTRN